MKIFAISFLSTFLLFLTLASATPILFNPSPENGTYITGGAEYTFSIHIEEENLNTSTVKFHIGSEEVWPDERSIFTMDCFQLETEWLCNKTVLISVAESGTKEYYFFEANDTSGNYSSLGNLTHPLIVIIDRTPPVITSYNFANMSYVSVNRPIKVKVSDLYSGVNVSSVISLVDWLYGNETWNSTWEPMTYEEETETYRADWDNSNLPNNSTWIVYVNASDNVGNWNSSKLGIVFIDNEYPNFEITFPSEGQKVFGSIEVKVYAKDAYSGIGSVNFEVDSISDSLSCEDSIHEYNCSGSLDTTQLTDGEHSIVFSVMDNAENEVNSSVSIQVDNKFPAISILSPKDNSFVSGRVLVNTSVGNVRSIEKADFRWTNLTSSGEWSMDCLGNYSCYTYWNTTSMAEGIYFLNVSITNDVGYRTSEMISVTVDNTKPELIIDSPTETIVNGTIYPRVIVIDSYGVNPDTIKFNVSNYSSGMNCIKYVEGKKYVCGGNLNTTEFEDGNYTLYFFASDLAGNGNSVGKELTIKNLKVVPGEEARGEEGRGEIRENVTVERNVTVPTIVETIEETFLKATSKISEKISEPYVYIPIVAFAIAAPLYLILRKRPVKKYPEIDEFFNEEQTNLHFIYTYIISREKSYLEKALSYLGMMKRVFKQKESIIKELSGEEKEKIERFYSGRKSRENFIDELNKILSMALEEKDEEKVEELVKEAKKVCSDFIEFSKEEYKLFKRLVG